MNRGTLLIRADANAHIGAGHVMRCLALAQAWQDAGGDAVFAMAEAAPPLEHRLLEENFRIVRVSAPPGSRDDLEDTRALIAAKPPSWTVLDGYRFDAYYQSEIKRWCRLLVMDDNGQLERYSADVVVNQNVHAGETLYAGRVTPETRLLLGPQYAILRNEFAAYRDWTREVAEVGSRVLVTMGGSDPSDFAPRILPWLAKMQGSELWARVVVGGGAGNAHAVKEAAANSAGRIEVLVDARNMAELMAWADLAIAGAGSTCWEMCLLGLPSIVVEVAENQQPIARQLEALGAAVNAGPPAEIDCRSIAQRAEQLLSSAGERFAMSGAARKLVDGWGRERVLEAMQMGDVPCD
ncbi:MAG TPA: UDP-2,4-diacetamido-2,4,6-trideoxy-beta-L-altropyranose hydrolase [Terriglobales bacterium]|jgi:UDP-2,4-diacetamido-2,4,6-trideoxy-beta-L-altropyranose hydrolase|nr:UDP-2,4-diacetamido-2,4,6-trideoxy-beta-L-altropyranose hydrolase [Terriglobales bacterium]